MLEGHTQHGVDLQQFDIKADELLFILPHQIHRLPAAIKEGTNYVKLGFDETCLSCLPKQYPFLINPLNNQKIPFTASAAGRLKAIFELLLDLLSVVDTEPELILAHLNSLLTEIDTAYFSTDKRPADNKLSQYIRFKLLVEDNLTEHTTIEEIAQQLALNIHNLYTLVKHYSGLFPKAFVTTG